MEENKDLINSEFELEQNDNTTVEAEQTESESCNNDINEVNNDEFDNLDSDIEINQEEEQVAFKKKPLIQVPIIISLVLVLVVAAGFFVMKGFFNTSVVGTWIVSEESTPDEATKATESVDPNLNYYTFKEDGTAQISLGTMRMVGTYTVTEGKDGNDNTIEINIPNALQDSFTYTVSGNIFSGRNLVLTSSYYNRSLNFESAKIITPELKPDPDFKVNDKLTGVWTYNDGYNKFSYEFNADGTALFNQYDLLYADGTYTYTDDKIVITYYISAVETGEMEINYYAEDDKLIINGYAYYKETPASVDQASK